LDHGPSRLQLQFLWQDGELAVLDLGSDTAQGVLGPVCGDQHLSQEMDPGQEAQRELSVFHGMVVHAGSPLAA
jgi:hypothetical protein